MRDYASIPLNMIKYVSIYLKNLSAEYARVLNMFDAVHSIGSLYKLLSSYQNKNLLRTLSNI